MMTKKRKRPYGPLYKLTLKVQPPAAGDTAIADPSAGPAPWKTTSIPELFVHEKNSCRLTADGRRFMEEGGDLVAPLGVRISGLAAGTCYWYTLLAAEGVSSDFYLDRARRTMQDIVNLIEALDDWGFCQVEVAQLGIRFAELALWAHEAARTHREWGGSESALAAKHPLRDQAAIALLDALQRLTDVEQVDSPTYALALRMFEDLVETVPIDLTAPVLPLALKAF